MFIVVVVDPRLFGVKSCLIREREKRRALFYIFRFREEEEIGSCAKRRGDEVENEEEE